MSRYEDEMAERGRQKSDDEYAARIARFDDRLRESIVIKRLIARIEMLEENR